MLFSKSRLRLLGATALAIPMALATSAIALADDLNFTLYNETSVTLTELYLSPSNVDDWEDDVLSSDDLGAGRSIRLSIEDGRTDCEYDILGVFADNDSVEDYGVDICNLGSYSFVEE